MRQNQPCALFRREPVFDERHIYILVAAVKFVADDGMADVREMDAYLMFAPGARQNPEQGESRVWSAECRRQDRSGKSAFDKKFCLRRRAIGADAIFHGDAAVFVLAERRVNQTMFFVHAAMHDGEVFFFDGAAFQNFSQFAGGPGIFRDDNHAAGFAVEPVDEMRLRGISQMQARAADQTGHLAVLGRMTDKSGGFVDDEQSVIFKNDLKKFFHNLSLNQAGVSFAAVKEKWNRLLPVLFVVVFALSRIPGMLPQNFSAAYAFAFCAGVYFSGWLAWALPLGVMLATDVALNVFHYHVKPFGFYLLLNYVVFAALIGLGRLFGKQSPFLKLLLGGLFGAMIFYLATNTLAWLQDPFYTKTIAGWIQALTTGHPDILPTTWEMFRNTLLSGGLFTALFVAAAKWAAPAESPAEKTAGVRDEESETEPEEAGA